MAEIDRIRKRAKQRYALALQPEDIQHAYADRVFLLDLVDTMSTEHLSEIRQMERDFREYMKGGGA